MGQSEIAQVEMFLRACEAQLVYDRLKEYIGFQHRQVREGYSLNVFVYAPNGEQLNLLTVGYQNPSILHLHCTDSHDNDCVIVTDCRAFHLLIKHLPLSSPEEKPKPPIGFVGNVAEPELKE